MITCPNNITGEASEDENVGAVWWEIPAAVDNSGFLPTVTVVPALIPPVSVPIGENLITYTAEDSNKNKAKCSFSIIIRGNFFRYSLMQSVTLVFLSTIMIIIIIYSFNVQSDTPLNVYR